jgi:hypothetical protein
MIDIVNKIITLKANLTYLKDIEIEQQFGEQDDRQTNNLHY